MDRQKPGTNPSSAGTGAARTLSIEFLYLDLNQCTRCRETDAHVDGALAEVARRVTARGFRLDVRKIHVDSAEQAREVGLISSPTIRLNGRDIVLDAAIKESPCESCGGVCGEEGIGCRVWTYQGTEYTAAPQAMIVDAILREVDGASRPGRDRPTRLGDLSENLQRFFEAKRRSERRSPAGEKTGCCA